MLVAALPPAVSVLTLARDNGAALDRIANFVLLATLVSMATITIALVLLLNGLLPAGR